MLSSRVFGTSTAFTQIVHELPVHSHVIYKHGLRPHRRRIWTTRPVPADGYIEQDEKRMIKDPAFTGGQICRSSSLVKIAVHVEAYGCWLPVDSKDMKSFREELPVRQCVDAAKRASSGVTWTMKTAVICRRLAPNVLHDVYLSTVRPSNGINVIAKHPERRPYSLAERQLDPRLNPAEFLTEFSLRYQSRRRIVSRHVVRPLVILAEGFND